MGLIIKDVGTNTVGSIFSSFLFSIVLFILSFFSFSLFVFKLSLSSFWVSSFVLDSFLGIKGTIGTPEDTKKYNKKIQIKFCFRLTIDTVVS